MQIATLLFTLLQSVWTVGPDGYYNVTNSGPLVETSAFPLAKCIRETEPGDSIWCQGNVGKLTIGGNPNHGHSSWQLDPRGERMAVAGIVVHGGTIVPLALDMSFGKPDRIRFEGVKLIAPDGANMSAATQLMGADFGRIEFVNCDFLWDHEGRDRAPKWGIRCGRGTWLFQDCYWETFIEWSIYGDCWVGPNVILRCSADGNGRGFLQFCQRPLHGPPMQAGVGDSIWIADTSVGISEEGDGGGVFTIAGCLGDAVVIERCTVDGEGGNGREMAVTCWAPFNGSYGQSMWFPGSDETNDYWSRAEYEDDCEERGEFGYATRMLVVRDCNFSVPGNTRTAFELSGARRAHIDQRMVWEESPKAQLSINPWEGDPVWKLTLGWRNPSQWPGFLLASGNKVRRLGRELSDAEINRYAGRLTPDEERTVQGIVRR